MNTATQSNPTNHATSDSSPSQESGATTSDAWPSLLCWIRFYSWTTLAASAYGIGIAHVFSVVGEPWTTSPTAGAVVAVHLFEVPVTLFAIGVAIFGLRFLNTTNRELYHALLSFLNVVNLAFFLFEVQLVLGAIARSAPDAEVWLTGSIAGILLTAIVVGFTLQVRLGLLLQSVKAGAR